MSLSVVVITHNEQLNIEACLQSVGFADEIIVVDNASSDQTVDLACKCGAKVMSTPDWPGFGLQKGRALAQVTGDWVLSLDADERVTPELQQELLQVMAQTQSSDCYAIPRSSWYCGRFMRHSGWAPDYVDRFFKTGTARFSDDPVHERLLHDMPAQRLKSPLLHYSFRNFSDVLTKIDRYSTASAEHALVSGRRATVLGAVGHGLWAFVRAYIFKAGFLDGSHGLALAISNAEGSYYRYVKLWQMTQVSPASEK
jgi:glycosyltransferase involved in cell wall biosynthesis